MTKGIDGAFGGSQERAGPRAEFGGELAGVLGLAVEAERTVASTIGEARSEIMGLGNLLAVEPAGGCERNRPWSTIRGRKHKAGKSVGTARIVWSPRHPRLQ